MLGETNLSEFHEVEQIRRSVAMLAPGRPAMDREDTLRVLEALKAALKRG